MSVKITYFVHGTTIDNEKGIATGWLDGKLSELGLKQAQELSDLIKDRHFDAVFCSDLKRAIDSAHLAFGDNYKIIQDRRLREINYGSLNGLEATFKDNLKPYIAQPFPGGESYEDVELRIKDFLTDLKKDYANQHIAIMSHQAPQLALEVLGNKKTWEQAIDTDWRKTKAWQAGWEYVV